MLLILLAFPGCDKPCTLTEEEYSEAWAHKVCEFFVKCHPEMWDDESECIIDHAGIVEFESARMRARCGAVYDSCTAESCMNSWPSSPVSCEEDLYRECGFYDVWPNACSSVED